jgi:hypothetical protein
MNARTSNLGRGGCYVDAFSPFPVNAPVKLQLTCEKRSFTANAIVTNSRTGMGMGLKFTEIEPEQLPVLEKWLGELSGAVPREPEASLEAGWCAKPESSRGQWYVLNELIVTLMRKGALSDSEGKSMLQKLNGQDVGG